MSGFFLQRGERGLNVGPTGSGKTEGAIFQLRNPCVYPVIIFDTKIEDKFFGVHDEDAGESLALIETFDDFVKLSKKPRKDWPHYILVRPETHEMLEVEELDKYSQLVYAKFGSCFVYYDELYNWHKNGQCGPGLLGLLTRGRSKGKTLLMSTQRPSWISRFCFTESNRFYLYRQTDARDRKTIEAMVPNYASYKLPPKYYFYYFEVGEHEIPQLFMPVPFIEFDPKKATEKIYRRQWL